MFTIQDILKTMDFSVIDDRIEYTKVYANNEINLVNLVIFENDERIFEYNRHIPVYYKGLFNKDATKVIVKEILDDVYKEYQKQLGIKLIIEEAEKEWKK